MKSRWHKMHKKNENRPANNDLTKKKLKHQPTTIANNIKKKTYKENRHERDELNVHTSSETYTPYTASFAHDDAKKTIGKHVEKNHYGQQQLQDNNRTSFVSVARGETDEKQTIKNR